MPSHSDAESRSPQNAQAAIQLERSPTNPSALLAALALRDAQHGPMDDGDVVESKDLALCKLLAGYVPEEPSNPKELLLVCDCLHRHATCSVCCTSDACRAC